MILYTGIGAKESGRHTNEEFLQIMNVNFTIKDWTNVSLSIRNVQLNFKDYNLPDDFSKFTLEDWIEYSGTNISNEQVLGKRKLSE